ncbi:DUF4177 domain-containing protein [Primorskyibacter sp. S187A]|uniref:DUF4177 domain-containing protein n=1 Tax=Primorskyibacter sp. S187A TaxID=3415130 RepID=UPI003C7A431D
MSQYEYKVIPAPTRGQKARGVKAPEARFALALEMSLNAVAEDGWEFLRAETLPSEERQGLTGSTTSYRNVLVFRRPVALDDIDADAAEDTPLALLEDRSEAEEPDGTAEEATESPDAEQTSEDVREPLEASENDTPRS